MVERNTFVSAYTMYRHLQQYCSHPSIYRRCKNDIDTVPVIILHVPILKLNELTDNLIFMAGLTDWSNFSTIFQLTHSCFSRVLPVDLLRWGSE